MKREILCLSCSTTAREIALSTRPKDSRGMPLDYPGEHVKRTVGRSIRHLLCDMCCTEITPGQEIAAVSTWSDYSGSPYYPWESEYLVLTL